MDPPHRVLAPAEVRWDGDRPVSVTFDDVYHGTEGTEETERVFLEPAKFDERIAAAESVTVGELGFGAGRNFAVTAERFLARSTGRLHYVAFEHAPMRRDDMARAARHSGAALHRALVDAWPPAISGWHRRRFAGGRVQLSLYFGDVLAGLADLAGRQGSGVDAWFLDGFAPRRNPEMWSAGVCEAVAALSRPGATVTSYSSAGVVKQGLRQAGFNVRRVDQRPRKWHTLLGVFAGHWSPWAPQQRSVSVVGAGFAGCSAARALAERGFEVTVHDTSVAAGASAIPAAVLHPRLLGDGSPAAALRAHGYAFAVWFYGGLPGIRSTGALQLPGPDGNPGRLERILPALPPDWIARVSAREASELAGVEVAAAGLHFSHAGLVEGALLCRALLDHPRIRLDRGPAGGGVTVVASASRVTDAMPELEVAPLAGQADLFPGARLWMPVLGDGYAAPCGSFQGVLGRRDIRVPAVGSRPRHGGQRRTLPQALRVVREDSHWRIPWYAGGYLGPHAGHRPHRRGHLRHRRARLEWDDVRRAGRGVDREPDRGRVCARHAGGRSAVPRGTLPGTAVAAPEPVLAAQAERPGS